MKPSNWLRPRAFPARPKFINAVLRNFLREREQTQKALAELKNENPALGYSHPEWLCERWRRRWDGEKLQRLLQWNNTPPTTYARVNTLKTDTERLAARWKEEGVEFLPRQWDWIGEGLVFELTSHPSLATLPSFQEGLFYVQDPEHAPGRRGPGSRTRRDRSSICAPPLAARRP